MPPKYLHPKPLLTRALRSDTLRDTLPKVYGGGIAIMISSGIPWRPRRLTTPTPSSLVARNVVVGGHRTTIHLEPVMWDALREIARWQQLSVHDLVTDIDRERTASSLTAAVRVYIVDFYRAAALQVMSDDTTRYAADKARSEIRISEAAALGSPLIPVGSNEERIIQSPVTRVTTFDKSRMRRAIRAVVGKK